jgi:hypothetical protein
MKYYLAHNETDVFHYGEITEEQQITTGQPNLEFFDTLEELKDRLSFFNVEFKDNESSIDEINIEEPNES